jgi:hypothetical protein
MLKVNFVEFFDHEAKIRREAIVRGERWEAIRESERREVRGDRRE